MSSKSRRIEIPSEEEVARYAGSAVEGEASESQADSAATGAQTEADAEAAAGEGQAAEDEQGESVRSGAEDWKDKFLRTKADMRNYRRRIENERAELMRYAHANLVAALLGVLDDLERTLEAGQNGQADSPFIKGVRLVHENFLKVLREHHVEPIDAVGKPFDPASHEALMQQESDEHPPGTVIQQVLRGYRLHDRVLRAAKVIVSQSSREAELPLEEEDQQAEATEAGEG